MSDYRITTDSSCDISIQTLAEWGVKCVDLTFRNTKTNQVLPNRQVLLSDFYQDMRNGTVFQTSAVNPSECRVIFEEELHSGRDIIHIAFSSGLSISSHSAELAAKDMANEYASRRITVVDSLCASAGQGLLVYLAVQKKKEGADFDTLVRYLSETAPKVCHWFTVDDLKYLKRGGRISAAAAFAATVLNIKPIMHVDDAGHLVGVSKVRGRKQAVKALAEKYQQLAEDPENGVFFISHGDCMEDALLLEERIRQKCGSGSAFLTDIGPVIGSHSGPGTLALFFIGRKR